MQNTLFPLALLCCTSLAAHATDPLQSAFEGDAKLRQRLDGLQDAAAPPSLQVQDWINSRPLTLSDLKGKIVVLDFWATWCGPCINSIPHTNELQEKYRDDGVVFIGVCQSRGAEKMAQTVSSKGIQYPVAADISGRTVEAYQVNGFPDYYIIDRQGVLRVADCANAKVEQVIEQLLKE